MKWFYNMKIGKKLVLAFLLVSLIAGVIGVIGVLNLRKIADLDTQLYEYHTDSLDELTRIM